MFFGIESEELEEFDSKNARIQDLDSLETEKNGLTRTAEITETLQQFTNCSILQPPHSMGPAQGPVLKSSQKDRTLTMLDFTSI